MVCLTPPDTSISTIGHLGVVLLLIGFGTCSKYMSRGIFITLFGASLCQGFTSFWYLVQGIKHYGLIIGGPNFC